MLFWVKSISYWALGIGHWALGIGHWALGIGSGLRYQNPRNRVFGSLCQDSRNILAKNSGG